MVIANQSNYIPLIAHYERSYDHLMYVGQYYSMEREETRDIIQQLFLHFAEIKIDLDLISNPRSYIITSFKRRLIDYHRVSVKKEMVLNSIFQDVSEASIDKKIEEQENAVEMVKKLKTVYDKLPGRCKKVIYLKFYEGLSNTQIMAQTGLSLQSVYNNLSEGIKIMRAELTSQQPQLARLSLKNLVPYIF